MTQVALHLEEKSIVEDLEYYFSEVRDKHAHVRPSKDIQSLIPDSTHINDGNEYIGNFLYPATPNSLDRIYIGISLPLFANNWGAAFLIQLLKTLKPNGAVILPVYSEGQAAEKGYWSRSSLENIFLSRSRWKGISNISAENDGVMSLRVGRKWPERIASTAEWFYQERTNLLFDQLISREQSDGVVTRFDPKAMLIASCASSWSNFALSAIVEHIIRDCMGQRQHLSVCDTTADNGQLAMELLLSPYINIAKAISHDPVSSHQRETENLASYFLPETNGRFRSVCSNIEQITFEDRYDVISFTGSLADMSTTLQVAVFERAWNALNPGGVMIVLERPFKEIADGSAIASKGAGLDEILGRFGAIRYYSRYVASELQSGVEISHYSKQIENALKQENETHENAFRVVVKS